MREKIGGDELAAVSSPLKEKMRMDGGVWGCKARGV